MFNTAIKIGGKSIHSTSPVYIIAEAGVNHGGDINIAMQLIDIASEAGADAVKFQAFRTEHLILDHVEKAAYQKVTTESKESQSEMLRKLELKNEQYSILKAYCLKKNIQFLITPFDEQSLLELEEIGVDAYKVASTDTTNLPFLIKIAKTKKPILLSTGMCDMREVEAAVATIKEFNKDLILLQCTANYPIEDDEANLKVISEFKRKFSCLVGYSDHSVGIGAAPFAIPFGAVVLEKHFTINKKDAGPDHLASLDPIELANFVKLVRKVEKYIGSDIKEPTKAEKLTKKALQKYLVAKSKINAGEVFSLDNIVGKRTGGIGISPLYYKEIIGKIAKKTFQKDQIIEID